MPLYDGHGNPLVMPPAPAPDAPSEEEAPDGTEVPEDSAPELIPAITAFIVYQLPEGQWQVATDLNTPLVVDRQPHGDDFTAGCATVLRDVQTQEIGALLNVALNQAGQQIVQATAQTVLQGQIQMGEALRKKMEEEKVAEQLRKDQQRRAGR